jgi:hypothetical protein
LELVKNEGTFLLSSNEEFFAILCNRKQSVQLIRRKAVAGEFIVLPHAFARQELRNITVADIVHVLVHGWHEEKKR